jgi:hypothetical protein
MILRDWSDWPTLTGYLAWAKGEGCAVSISGAPDAETGGYSTACITAPSGNVAIEVFRGADDPLMSATVARLDRRLGIKSYMFK